MTTVHLMPTHLPPLATAHSGHGAVALASVAFIALAVGVAAGFGLSSVVRPKPLVQNRPQTPQIQRTPTASQHAHTGAAAGQRAALVTGMLTIRGLVEDPQAADVIDESLRTAGVTVFDPTGDTKDPRYHRVRHTEPAPDAGKSGTIARTLAPGYIDAGRVLQPADVVVYL